LFITKSKRLFKLKNISHTEWTNFIELVVAKSGDVNNASLIILYFWILVKYVKRKNHRNSWKLSYRWRKKNLNQLP